jgi:hypothetical protein
LDNLQKGDIVTIFTPDDTHFDISMAAITRGLHVMVTKPPVHTIEQHIALHQAAKEHNVLVAIEVHKRWVCTAFSQYSSCSSRLKAPTCYHCRTRSIVMLGDASNRARWERFRSSRATCRSRISNSKHSAAGLARAPISRTT